MHRLLLSVVFVFFSMCAYSKSKERQLVVSSPNNVVKVEFLLKEGEAFYKVYYLKKLLIKESRLGFVLKDLPALDGKFKITASKQSTLDERWDQPWGEIKTIRNHYNSLSVTLEEQSDLQRQVIVEFRVYNDGLGFRHEIPAQFNLKKFIIQDELTEFAFVQDFSAWWIPAYGDEMDSEYLYKHTKLSEIKEKTATPLTLEYENKLFVSLHEA